MSEKSFVEFIKFNSTLFWNINNVSQINSMPFVLQHLFDLAVLLDALNFTFTPSED